MKPVVVAITGGISSGKSFVCKLLEKRGYTIFYCDDEARRLMHTDKALRSALKRLIGENTYQADGTLNKPVVTAFIKSGGREAINALVHPAVREAFLQWKEKQTADVVFMECALLFESGFDKLVDTSVLVSAPDSLRIKRLMQRNGIDERAARAWLNLQMSEEEKRQRVDVVIDNGEDANLEEQLDKLLGKLTF